LKNRVTQYTQVARQPKRLLRMISQTRSMQIVTTHSEAEALLLEAQLIKRYRPPYNVLLRDDKSFPFILLREDHDFPRVQLHRGARRHKGQYYGPFASAGSVRNTLNSLQKLFLLRSCTDSFFAPHTNDVPEAEVLQAFLVQFYEEVPPPRLILTDRVVPEADLLCEAFSVRAERKVSLKTPVRGEQARMIRQAARNAEEELDRRLAESS